MPFFEVPDPLPEQPQQSHVRDPRHGPPEDVLGTPVTVRKVIGRSSVAIVVLAAIVAYEDGFEFQVIATSEKADQRWRHITYATIDDDGNLSSRLLRVGIQFSNLSKATSLESLTPQYHFSNSEPVLMQRGGHGGQNVWIQNYWVWPLPPPGDLHFVCEWPHYGIKESWLTLDAESVIQAARETVPLWPDD